MLDIQNLQVQLFDENKTPKPILRGLNLHVPSGEIHVIMGPNGSGKSTLANVLAGHAAYPITAGSVTFAGEDLLALTPEMRAARGVFLAFQYPIEIPGVNNMYFLREALNSQRKQLGLARLDAADFLAQIKQHLKTVGLDEKFLHRAVNEGFSGGEKKRNELLQMLVLTPRLMILDETDSGLDIDALQMVSRCLDQLRDPQRAVLIITHYPRLLEHIPADVVHLMVQGRVIQSGDKHLAYEIEKRGYSAYLAGDQT